MYSSIYLFVLLVYPSYCPVLPIPLPVYLPVYLGYPFCVICEKCLACSKYRSYLFYTSRLSHLSS